MTYRGKVKDGVVVLEGGAKLADGTEVRVEPVETLREGQRERRGSVLFQAAERAKPTGIADLAINHDHYLYGHPRVTSE